MLAQKFLKIWFAGELDERAIKSLMRKLSEALARHERRILFRFYLNEGSRESYYDALRRILLSNVTLSVLAEEKPISDLEKDLEKISGEEIVLVLGKGAPRPHSSKGLIIEEVEKDA